MCHHLLNHSSIIRVRTIGDYLLRLSLNRVAIGEEGIRKDEGELVAVLLGQRRDAAGLGGRHQGYAAVGLHL